MQDAYVGDIGDYGKQPRITKQECAEIVVKYNKNYLHADLLLILEYPRQSPRFYFFFLHENHAQAFRSVYDEISANWSGFCEMVNL